MVHCSPLKLCIVLFLLLLAPYFDHVVEEIYYYLLLVLVLSLSGHLANQRGHWAQELPMKYHPQSTSYFQIVVIAEIQSFCLQLVFLNTYW